MEAAVSHRTAASQRASGDGAYGGTALPDFSLFNGYPPGFGSDTFYANEYDPSGKLIAVRFAQNFESRYSINVDLKAGASYGVVASSATFSERTCSCTDFYCTDYYCSESDWFSSGSFSVKAKLV